MSDVNLISTEEILSVPASEVLSRVATSPGGLTAEEVSKRLEDYGHNEITRKVKRPVLIEFLSHFKSPVTIHTNNCGYRIRCVG